MGVSLGCCGTGACAVWAGGGPGGGGGKYCSCGREVGLTSPDLSLMLLIVIDGCGVAMLMGLFLGSRANYYWNKMHNALV